MKRLRLAVWAFFNPDNLTMLRHELNRDGNDVNSNGRSTLAACRAMWYKHYLTFKVR
jgi:hypothetical protein